MYELTDLGARAGRGVPRARHGASREPDRAADGADGPPSTRRAGDRVAGTRRFRVDGMDCGACAKTVEQAVAALPGVASAQVSFGNGTMAVAGEAPDDGDHAARSRARGTARSRPSARSVADDTPFWRRDARALSTTIAVGLLLAARGRVAGVGAAGGRRAAVPAVDGGRRLADRARRPASRCAAGGWT